MKYNLKKYKEDKNKVTWKDCKGLFFKWVITVIVLEVVFEVCMLIAGRPSMISNLFN